MRVLLISLFDEWCLGLRAISSVIRARGHRVTMAHLRGMPEMNDNAAVGDPQGYHAPPASVTGADFRALLDLTAQCKPEVIGISVSFSHLFGLAVEVTRRLRTVSDSLIVWGGADTTANPDLSIEHADVVCVGEGDGAVADLFERLEQGAAYDDIPNLWVRKNGEIRKNDIRKLEQDLDSLPFCDFDDADKYWISRGRAMAQALPDGSHLTTNFPIMATRGCPYSCTFCCNSLYRDMYGNKDYVRVRSVEHTLREIEQYIAAHPGTLGVEFHDDVFGVRQDWLEEFADKYPARVGLPFFCYTYPSIARPEFVNAIKRAGVGFVAMGLQTGSQRILREVYGRNAPRDKTIQAVERLHKAGIPVILDLIGSNPFETDEDRLETLTLLLDLPKGSFILHETNSLAFYRNYPITNMAARMECLNPFIEGRNLAMATESGEFRMWNALLQLPQFAALDREAILAMAHDPHLREHPEIVEGLLKALIEATYIPGTRLRRRDREEQLAGELARYKGSRAVRLYFGAKKWFRRILPPRNGLFSGWRSTGPRAAATQ